MTEILIKVAKASSALNAEWFAKAPDGTFGLGDTIADALNQLAIVLEFRDIEPDPPKLSLDEELLAKIKRREELRPFVRECTALKKLIKPAFDGEPLTEIGPFDVKTWPVDVKGYTVKPYSYINWSIKANLQRLGVIN